MTELKLGKLPAVHDNRTLRLATYLDPGTHVKVPAAFGTDSRVKTWGMLGNDKYGDCVWAGACHEHELWTAEAYGIEAPFKDGNALSAYSAVTGFKPDDPATDQGTDVLSAYKYRQHTGVLDAVGKRHKITAYVQVDHSNVDRVVEAIYLFGCVGIGIQFPETAMDQFNANKPWSVVKGAKVDGGHYIPGVGLHNGMIEVVTWGKRIGMTKEFFATYADEVFVPLSAEHFTDGRSPYGFDVAALQRDLAALKS